MAEKYVGKKFDDPDKKVDPSVRDIYDSFPKEAERRAFQGIANRVIGGTNGTQGPLITAGCTLGTTAGFKIATGVTVVINGAVSTCIAQDNLPLPDGTLPPIPLPSISSAPRPAHPEPLSAPAMW